ncbi:YciI family protein [Microbacterium insulae]|uniref:YciI family protein n=1 Tax=Microbacterium insulae TaxID=483014 RepID=A0ABW3AHI8_9MICO
MEYAILAVESEEDFSDRTDEQASAEYWAAWAGYVAALRESGVMITGAGLQPPFTATTVRLRGGSAEVQDGPFADVKESLGGVFVIDVPDLDAALEWASRCPAAVRGSVEVRPVIPPMT